MEGFQVNNHLQAEKCMLSLLNKQYTRESRSLFKKHHCAPFCSLSYALCRGHYQVSF